MKSTYFCGFRGLLAHRFVHTACTRVNDDMSPLLAIRQGEAGRKPACPLSGKRRKKVDVRSDGGAGGLERLPVVEGGPAAFRRARDESGRLFM